MSEAPVQHLQDAQKLTADGYVHLYEIVLRNNQGTVFLSDSGLITWQGQTYDSAPITMTGEKETSTEEVARPILTVYNPENVLASFIVTRVLEKSIVKRKQVLRANIDGNNNIFDQRTWFIGRVTSFLRGQLTVELRNLTDGPNFMMPRRQYLPPEFPVVSVS